jgi:hypothetical protein
MAASTPKLVQNSEKLKGSAVQTAGLCLDMRGARRLFVAARQP